MNQNPTIIDTELVKRLISSQFPKWKDLPIKHVAVGGWDNRTFHLGNQMLVRLPSAEVYSAKVEIEQKWFPRLAPFLPLAIPTPLAMGEPEEGYPWKWSVYRWIEGETAASAHINNLSDFASSLAQFLIALHKVDAKEGPVPGPHNFYRAGSLATYDEETRQAIEILKNKIDANAATELWEVALETTWQYAPVWVHGDISTGNLLVYQGKLNAVIDFGGMGIGDPACDLVIAWKFFSGESRKTFREILPLDKGTWARGRAWALWKALIVEAGMIKTNAIEASQSTHTIHEVLADYKSKV